MTKEIIFKRKLSPTSINTYYKYPRAFYYNYIEKIKTKPSIQKHLYILI
jgi:hypothetical protein